MSEKYNDIAYYPSYDACRISAERLESIWWQCDKTDPSYPGFKADLESFAITYELARRGILRRGEKRRNGKQLDQIGRQISENFARADSRSYKDQAFTKANVVSPEWFKGEMPTCVIGAYNSAGQQSEGLVLTRDDDWNFDAAGAGA